MWNCPMIVDKPSLRRPLSNCPMTFAFDGLSATDFEQHSMMDKVFVVSSIELN
jgi:hypothetical protein